MSSSSVERKRTCCESELAFLWRTADFKTEVPLEDNYDFWNKFSLVIAFLTAVAFITLIVLTIADQVPGWTIGASAAGCASLYHVHQRPVAVRVLNDGRKLVSFRNGEIQIIRSVGTKATSVGVCGGHNHNGGRPGLVLNSPNTKFLVVPRSGDVDAMYAAIKDSAGSGGEDA